MFSQVLATLFLGNDKERFKNATLDFAAFILHPSSFPCGCSSMVERQLPKLDTRVRFPSPALFSRILAGFFFIFALSAAPGAAAKEKAAAEAIAFPQQESDLKPDPAARFGRLENEVRYVVLSNHEPRDRASLRLLILAGSLNEKEDQRGLAHFLEHMAFNGSTHYPPGTIVEFLQRMGMSFGADVNASTSFDRTIYRLELAHADNTTLLEGMRVFSDYARGLLLIDEQIDKERGVILSEKRASDSAGYRNFVAEFEGMLGTTLLPRRLTIGLPEVITKARRERFTDFWNTWYRPEKMVVVAVGDFGDQGAVEKIVRDGFANLRARAPIRRNPELGKLAKFEGVRPIFHAEPETAATNISIRSITPYSHEADSAARRQDRLRRTLVLAMLNRRFSILGKREDAPFSFASAAVSEQFDFFRDASVHLLCKSEQWAAALALGEQELRRAIEHGFTAGELSEASANLDNQLEQASKSANTRHSNALADRIVGQLLIGEVFITPADELALLKPALHVITPADCQAALRKDFGGNGSFVAVTGNAQIPGDATAAIALAYEQAHAVAVTPPDADLKMAWGYTDFGPPGTIAKREHIADLDLELVTFENGARLNLKRTNFEAGRINLMASVGDGTITEPVAQRGVALLARGTFLVGGLGKHSADDLRQLFAGKNVGWQFSPELDTLQLSGRSTPDDLLLQLQLLAAELSDPGYRPEALRVAHKGLEQFYLSLNHTVNGPLATEVANLLANGDPRFGVPKEEIMMARTIDEVKAWLTPQLARGPLEVALVGDLDIEASIAAAARTIGALPRREAKPALPELKKVTFPAQPFTKSYVIDSEIPKGAVFVYWPTDDLFDARRGRRLNLLADILQDRLRVRVREAIGGTYSPRAQNNSSDVFPGYGYMAVSIDIDPAMAGKISDLAVEIADELKQKGVTDDEFKRAREPTFSAATQSMRDNTYWLPRVVARAQEKPERLDWTRMRLADIEAIRPAEISALAAKFLGRERASRATILPATKEPDDASASK
jgi:zinc protease